MPENPHKAPQDPVRYLVEWDDLKTRAIAATRGETSNWLRPENAHEAIRVCTGDSWRGYETWELREWLTSGYETEAIQGLENALPVREKRRLLFNEEEGEFHFDLAASGVETFYSEWTPQIQIPGVRIEVEIGIVSSTPHRILTEYFKWLNGIIAGVEAAGIDPQVTLTYTAARRIINQWSSKPFTTIVRVKEEGTVSDFNSWSAMVSPASFRSLMFVADSIHADARNGSVCSSHGQRDRSGWTVKFDSDLQVIRVDCAWSPRDFPRESMTDQFRSAMAEIAPALMG